MIKCCKKTPILFFNIGFALAALVSSAHAAPIKEFKLKLPFGAQEMTVAADGSVWLTEFAENKIGHMSALGVLLDELPVPTPGSGPAGITVGADGNIWFVENAGAGAVGRVLATSPHTITEFVPPSPVFLSEIVSGADGNLWYTRGNVIGRVTLEPSVSIDEFPVASGYADGIAADVEGNIWFTDFVFDKIGVFNVASPGTIREYDSVVRGPRSLTVGEDGNIWYVGSTDANVYCMDRLDPTKVSHYTLGASSPGNFEIASTPEGSIWITESAANKVARFSTISKTLMTEYPLPGKNTLPRAITADPFGNVWIGEYGSGNIGKINWTRRFAVFERK